ncbi:MAG: bifunctional 5,10-methylenetetrahydrofolate dehydrogenase/5,10-methenyltetrahydrofolate cyclohydrolase [candidate division WOR-3 bacterium]
MEKILKGKIVAEKILETLKNQPKKRKLGVLKVGHDPGSSYYLNSIVKEANKLEILVKTIDLEETTPSPQIKEYLKEMVKSKEVDGILIMEPLPKEVSFLELIEIIGKDLDVEGVHPYNLGKLLLGIPKIIPSTPGAVLELMKFYNIDPTGKNVVIIGRSNVVGKPLANLLLRKSSLGNATVTVCHSKTQRIKEISKQADILIVAIGYPEFVTEEFVKEGAIVIDVGTNEKNGKIVGDVHFESVEKKAMAITPVPGGIGSITTAMLLSNLYKL